MSRVYLSNSGSEANEKAFKIVRQIGQLKHGGKKTGILYRARDYHGTTIGTLKMCIRDSPLPPPAAPFPSNEDTIAHFPCFDQSLPSAFQQVLFSVAQLPKPASSSPVYPLSLIHI